MVQQAEELLQDILFLHPPIDTQSRWYYLSALQYEFNGNEQNKYNISKNIWILLKELIGFTFTHGEIKMSFSSRDQGKIVALEFVINVLQKDLEYWLKHLKHKKRTQDTCPIISFIFGEVETCNNQERIEYVLKCFRYSICRKIKVYRKILGKLISIFALYCGAIDHRSQLKYSDNMSSLKYRFSKQLFTEVFESRIKDESYTCKSKIEIYDGITNNNNTTHKLKPCEKIYNFNTNFCHLFILKPAWLSLLVVMIASKIFDSENIKNDSISLSNLLDVCAPKVLPSDYVVPSDQDIVKPNEMWLSMAIDKLQSIFPCIAIFVILYSSCHFSVLSNIRFKDLKINRTIDGSKSEHTQRLDDFEISLTCPKKEVKLDSDIIMNFEDISKDMSALKKLYDLKDSIFLTENKCTTNSFAYIVLKKLPIMK